VLGKSDLEGKVVAQGAFGAMDGDSELHMDVLAASPRSYNLTL